jgi:hypothetical protein
MRSIRIAVRPRTKHNRARVRVTRPGRRLSDQERREIETRLRAEGRLQEVR